MVKCKICDKKLKRITASHLKQHNITVKEYINIYGKENLFDDYLRKLYDTASKESFMRRHGKELGINKYNEYVKFHSYKNSFEYKQNKHGWTKEQYDEYNKNRAVTKKLCIKKHGTNKGLKIYNNYCKKQVYAGTSIEYFKDKYGEIEGILKYKEICKKKASFNPNTHLLHSSKMATELFDKLTDRINDLDLCDIYYNTKNNKEYFIKIKNTYYLYDYVIPSIRLCIEFNGNYWHMNPEMYDKHDKCIGKTAEQIWKQDAEKIKAIKQRNFDVIIVWEKDYINNKDKTLGFLENEIRKRILL